MSYINGLKNVIISLVLSPIIFMQKWEFTLDLRLER